MSLEKEKFDWTDYLPDTGVGSIAMGAAFAAAMGSAMVAIDPEVSFSDIYKDIKSVTAPLNLDKFR